MPIFLRLACAIVIINVLATPVELMAELVFINTKDFSGHADGQKAPADYEWMEDYESFRVYGVAQDKLKAANFAGGESWMEPEPQEIRLQSGIIDTSTVQISSTRQGLDLNANPGKILRLVQFRAPVKPTWLESLQALDVSVISYVSQYAYLVAGSSSAAAEMDKLDVVRWTGEYLPEYRIHPEVSLRAALNPDDSVRLIVQAVNLTQTSLDGVDASMRMIGAKITSRGQVGELENFRLVVPIAAVEAISQIPEVIWIEPEPDYELHGERETQIAAGAFAPGPPLPTCVSPGYSGFLSMYGVGGSGKTIQLMDSGLDQGIATNLPGTAHADLIGRIAGIFNATTDASGNDQGGHGTLNAGIIMGNASLGTLDVGGFTLGQGVAPLARVYGTKIFRNNGSFSIGANTLSSLITNAMQSGAGFSSNSWGANLAGDYNADSQEFDFRVRDGNTLLAGHQPIVIMVSTGNAGDSTASGVQTIGAPATAKNVIAVGASENCDANGTDGCLIPPAEADSLSDLPEFTSRGPTNDGRIGVTIVAPGTHISGPASTTPGYNGSSVCDTYFPVGQTNYARSTGTSHSTPIAAGGAILISEFLEEAVPMQFGGLGGVAPSPALVKALMILGADNMAGGANGKGGALAHHPEPMQGWGRLNLKNIFDGISSTVIRDQSDNVVFTSSGQAQDLTVFSINPGKPVRVVLVWTDAPGNPAVIATLVNNLDLEVTYQGITYKGNVFNGGFAAMGGAADTVNNMEAVYLPNVSGSLDIRVRATNLAGDGIPGNGFALDQDFALVISNATEASSAGRLRMDRDSYRCADEIIVTMSDLDLKGDGWTTVGIVTSALDGEFVTLMETPPNSGAFEGRLPIGLPPIIPDNGLLQVQTGDELMAYAIDADNGSGEPAWMLDYAVVDCEPPVISNIQVMDIGFDRFTVTWNTSKPASSEVSAGVECGPFTHASTSVSLVQSHARTLIGLSPCTDYLFVVYGRDAIGNSAVSSCMTLRTLGLTSSLEDDLEPTPLAEWTHFATQGVDDWSSVVFASSSSPTHSWFSADVATIKDASLVTPPLTLHANSVLTFQHTHGFEAGSAGYDGGVIEISTNGGAVWQDLGPHITQGAYTHTISSGFSSPIAGRQAWSGGTLGTMRQVVVDLGTFAGSNRLIRFRIACDSSVAGAGWYIDDVVIQGPGPCPNTVEFGGWTLYE